MMSIALFQFSPEKNLILKRERNISFDEIIALINSGGVLDVLDHPNQQKYPDQYIYVINVDGYCYLVPFIKKGNTIFLKTIIPSRKATREYINGGK